MGDECFKEAQQCFANCYQLSGYWEQVACLLDCEVKLAACLVGDFTGVSASIGTVDEVKRASIAATMMEGIADGYRAAAMALRSRADRAAAAFNVTHSNGSTEPFSPHGVLFPSIVRAGVSVSDARAVTDSVVGGFADRQPTSVIRASVERELGVIDAALVPAFRAANP